MSTNYVVLLLGSNKNNPMQNIAKAIAEIENSVGEIVKKSEIKETKAIEFDSNNIFCNIAIGINCDFSPMALLTKLKEIEIQMGRIKDSRILGGYFDREIDIDIVSFNAINFQCDKLEIPHQKHVFERDFSISLLKQISYYTK